MFGIQHINCSNMGECWIEEFIKTNFTNKSYKKLCIANVFGERYKIDNCKKEVVFWCYENLEKTIQHRLCLEDEAGTQLVKNRVKEYGDYMLSDSVLSLAFKNMELNNYMRFPLWITYIFQPYFNKDDIRKTVQQINQAHSLYVKEAVCINSHDLWGLRTKICDDLQESLDITYAGKWRNNTDELWNKYGNNKLRYLNMFKFNICPENMDAPDYCTEKLFDALRCGCIPIYAGCLNNPEPGIVNNDFIIMWDLDGDNYENIKLIKRLQSDENFYRKFMQQDKLTPETVDYVADRFDVLRQKLSEILL